MREEHAGCYAPAATASGSSGGFNVPTAAPELRMPSPISLVTMDGTACMCARSVEPISKPLISGGRSPRFGCLSNEYQPSTWINEGLRRGTRLAGQVGDFLGGLALDMLLNLLVSIDAFTALYFLRLTQRVSMKNDEIEI